LRCFIELFFFQMSTPTNPTLERLLEDLNNDQEDEEMTGPAATQTFECLQHIEDAHDDCVWEIAWSLDGLKLISCSSDKQVKVWQRDSKTCTRLHYIETIEEHSRTVRSVHFHPNNRSIATASFDGEVAVLTYDAKQGQFEKVDTLEGHDSEVKCVRFHSNGSLLAHCGRDKAVWIRELDPDAEDFGGSFDAISITHHTQDVKSVAWHPSEELLISTSYDDTVRVWSNDNGQEDQFYELCVLTGHKSTVWRGVFDPDSNPKSSRFATCSQDKSIKIWKRGKNGEWKDVCTVPNIHEGAVFSIDWSSSGIIASGGADNKLTILKEFGDDVFDVCGDKEMAHEQDINCVAWCPTNPDLLATACDDGSIKLWLVTMPSA